MGIPSILVPRSRNGLAGTGDGQTADVKRKIRREDLNGGGFETTFIGELVGQRKYGVFFLHNPHLPKKDFKKIVERRLVENEDDEGIYYDGRVRWLGKEIVP